LPSYVDDVLEFDSFEDFPTVGEGSKIYIDKEENKTYRWGGSVYVAIGREHLFLVHQIIFRINQPPSISFFLD
jgi:hypothetical protein